MDKFNLLPREGFQVFADMDPELALYRIYDADLLILSGYLDNAIAVNRMGERTSRRIISDHSRAMFRAHFAQAERNLLDTFAMVGL